MSYQEIKNCRFYVSILQYLKALNKLEVWESTEGFLREKPLLSFLDINPSARGVFESTGGTGQWGFTLSSKAGLYSELMPDNNNFFMVLGHEFKNVQCFLRRGETDEGLATTELINFGAKIPQSNGFSIGVGTSADGNTAQIADLEQIKVVIGESGNLAENTYDANTPYRLGSFLYGTYFEQRPNMSLKISRNLGTISRQKSYNGSTFSNQMNSKPPLWCNGLGAWQLDDGSNPIPHSLSRSTRKVFDLKFTFNDSFDLFGPNQSLSSMNITSDGYGSDVEDNEFKSNVLNDDNFMSTVWFKTLGPALPFVLQYNTDSNSPDNFVIARFMNNTLTMNQISHTVYEISVKIEEVY